MSKSTSLHYNRFSKARKSLSHIEEEANEYRKPLLTLTKVSNFPQVETFGSQRQFINELEDPPSSVRDSSNKKAESRHIDSYDYEDRVNKKLFEEETFRGSHQDKYQKDSLDGINSMENKSRQSELEQLNRINSEADHEYTTQQKKCSDCAETKQFLSLQPKASEKDIKLSPYTKTQLITHQGVTFIKYETYLQTVSELKDQIYQFQLKDISNNQMIAKLTNEIEKYKTYIVSLQLQMQYSQRNGKQYSNGSSFPKPQETGSFSKQLVKGTRSSQTRDLHKRAKSIGLAANCIENQFERAVKVLNSKMPNSNVKLERETQSQVCSPCHGSASSSRLYGDLSRSFESNTIQDFPGDGQQSDSLAFISQRDQINVMVEKPNIDLQHRSGSPPSGAIPRYSKQPIPTYSTNKVPSLADKIDSDEYKILYQPRRMSLDLHMLERANKTPSSMAEPVQLTPFYDCEPNYSELHDRFNEKLGEISLVSTNFKEQNFDNKSKVSGYSKLDNEPKPENQPIPEKPLLSVDQNKLKSTERYSITSNRGSLSYKEPKKFSFDNNTEHKSELSQNIPERESVTSDSKNYESGSGSRREKRTLENKKPSRNQNINNPSKNVNFNSQKAQEVLEYVRSMIQKK